MEVTINYNGQAVAVEVTLEVYEFLDRADHKAENLSHEQRRHYYIKRGWMKPPKEKAICTKTAPPKRNRKKTSAKKS